MSESSVIRARIEFLSGYTGLGWMEIDRLSMTLIRITHDDGTDISGSDGISYRVIPE